MTAPVEARSLSSLTTLFANPPQYPRNPTHKVLEPLNLYIVRVPGSRDIFLSPLKPPTKASISAEAIQSSLYYFHISTPQDEVVKESLEKHRRSWSAEQGSRVDEIHRKPVPSSFFTERSTGEAPEDEATGLSHSSRPVTKSEGDIPDGSHIETAKRVVFRSQDEGSVIARKPVGPRPDSSRLKTADSGVIERKPVGSSGGDGRTGQRASTEVPAQFRAMDSREGRQLNSDGCPGSQCSSNSVSRSITDVASASSQLPPPLLLRPSYSLSEHEMGNDFRVTIIRRDPSSGSQWNIGSLSRVRRPAMMEQDSIGIEITTPGYQKFARQFESQAPNLQAYDQAPREHQGGSTEGYGSITQKTNDSPAKASRRPCTHFEPTSFTRDMTLNRPPGSQHHHHRSSSSESFPSSLPQLASSISPTTPSQLTFFSPWNGTCTFTTGMDGRSLKCRHKLPSSSTSEPSDNSVLVAELRFNLPWSALRSRDTNTEPSTGAGRRTKTSNSLAHLGEDAKHSLKRGMARFRQEIKSSTSSDTDLRPTIPGTAHARDTSSTSNSFSSTFQYQYGDDSDDEAAAANDSFASSSSGRMDLKLGRERAGGGRKGKSAKLGKLVLRDEGLKMADLVVAACMGVWWNVYEGRGVEV
ncbi:hypothetical protein EPUS_03120 [Endocarpon pusillum Z07020]|uniref:Uncharacterized protein n=1 Tax=Endocarpon pusillum (strain Z07020 / HMAS-L-300199) TaxID=1263415 RepID=U1G7A4_ENDPU|nr:uncharacterized protein EPUS_03120 [Endocarpon pusillum Z07020]ERF73287.1 hypothetical protein EPUS_03120 [Endocarpon pusillum Z07020]